MELAKDMLIYIFDFLGKYSFIEIGCDLRALGTSGLAPLRILQNGIEQIAEFLFSLILKSVSSIYQNIIQARITMA